MRRVSSVAQRAKRVEAWRTGGRIQPFNWIEPLLPRPLDRVPWVPRLVLTNERRAELARDAAEVLDGRLVTLAVDAVRRTRGALLDGDFSIDDRSLRRIFLIFLASWEGASEAGAGQADQGPQAGFCKRAPREAAAAVWRRF